MRRVALFVGIVLAVGMAGCMPQEPAVDMAAETEALRAQVAAYDAAVEALDGAAVAGFYTDDCRCMPGDEPTVVGPAAMQAFVEGFAAIEGVSVDLGTPEIHISAAGDMAYTVASVDITVPGPDGPITVPGRDVHIWLKQADGSWKLSVDIWNSEMPFPHPPAEEG